MLCELLLSSVWFLFVIFWLETISVWLFLCLYYQDRVFYHWGSGELADDPDQLLYVLSRKKDMDILDDMGNRSVRAHADVRK